MEPPGIRCLGHGKPTDGWRRADALRSCLNGTFTALPSVTGNEGEE